MIGRTVFVFARKQRQIFLLTLSIVLVSAVLPLPSLAEDADFGAETIDDESAPLPVDLAEEPEGQKATKDASPSIESAARTPRKVNGKAPAASDSSAEGAEPNEEVTAILNVKDVEIAALVKSFSKLTRRNYIVDSNVKGKVTMHLAAPVTMTDALKILDSVLLLKGFTTVPVSENTWKVIAAKDARQTTIPTVEGMEGPRTDVLVTQLVRLRHVKASELQQTLSQFVSRDGLITAASSTNALILIDSAANIDRLVELSKELDLPAVDQDITIIPIKHAEAPDVAEKINNILGTTGGDDQSQSANALRVRQAPRPVQINLPPQGNPAGGAPNLSVSDGGEGRALPVKVIADERTNSLIVVADPELTLKVRALAEQLDSEIDRSGSRFWVYRLQHADADELANILAAVISGTSTESRGGSESTGSSFSRSQRGSRDSSGAGGSRFSSSSRDRGRFGSTTGDRDTSASRSSGRSAGSSGEIVSASGRVNFEGEVSVAADPSTNSIIINASRTDYLRLKEVIDQLDIKRRQVLVEGTILEVSLTKDEGIGVEFQATGANQDGGVITQTNYGGLTNLLTNPSRLNDLTIAAASTGSLTLPGGVTIPSQAFLISAVSANQNVNVLSSPTILTTDNQEAEIIVGENVPFVTSTSTSDVNLNNTFNQIDRQDVGITLRITPQIGTGSFVSLKIFVEISNVVTATRNDPNGPTTSIRTTETNVEVKSGQMVVTGGLISDSVTESTRGVPFWEDIPVLGNFFRRDDENRRRVNLLMFITPRIVGDQFTAREVTLTERDKLQKVIEEQDSQPARSEILHSDNLDRVTEVTEDEASKKPSTILPPAGNVSQAASLNAEEQAALERTKNALAAITGVPQETVQPAPPPKRTARLVRSGDVLDITVKPKLPDTSTSRVAPAQKSDAKEKRTMTTAKNVSALENKRIETSESRSYVVLRGLSPAKSSDTVGLVVDGARGSKASDFFQIGGRYQAGTNPSEAVVVIGKYNSLNDAAKSFPNLQTEANWSTLSAQDTLTLGRTSWQKLGG